MTKKTSINVTKAILPSISEYIDEISSLWETNWITNNGVKHEELREMLKYYLGVDNIDLFTNGHTALETAINAFELSGEIITTPFTFISTANAIVRNGIKPVFCDIKPDDYTIDTNSIEALITEKTSAIMPVHVYGNICDVEEIDRIAKKYGLRVIYDAAHAFGQKINGRYVGTFGDASCFSFHATKAFNTIEGGAVCFNDACMADVFSKLKNFGLNNETEDAEYIGFNAKMNEFSAAMGICNLRHFEEHLAGRKKVAEFYNSELNNIEGVLLPRVQKGVESNYSYYPIVIDEKYYGYSRNQVFDMLKKAGINCRKYFYPAVNDMSCYKELLGEQNTPVAKYISERVLCLPIYSDLAAEHLDMICEVLRNKSL